MLDLYITVQAVAVLPREVQIRASLERQLAPMLVFRYLSSERGADLDFIMPLGKLNSCPLGRRSCDGLFSILGSRVASLMISSRDILSWLDTSMPGMPVRQRASSSLSDLSERIMSSCCGKIRLSALKNTNQT